jgi:hypothetical protein
VAIARKGHGRDLPGAITHKAVSGQCTSRLYGQVDASPPTSRAERDALTTAPWPIRGFIVYPSSHSAARQRQPFCLPSTNPEPAAKQLADIFGENHRAGHAL